MILFYTPDIQDSHDHFLLTEEESKHAIRVLRLQLGDSVYLVNGTGDIFAANIVDPHPKRTSLKILNVQKAYQQNPYALHVAIAPTKNMDRLEWFIEKSTEIGIHQITPIICEHSERKEVKIDRLAKVAISAMKQSLKAYLPKVNDSISFQEFVKGYGEDKTLHKAIAHCVDSNKIYINQIFRPKSNYLILIGPEGDFSPREIQLAEENGFEPISLGQARLRTETAALAAVLEVSLFNR